MEIQSAAPESAWRNLPFSFLFTQLLDFSFGFSHASLCRSPESTSFLPRQDRVKGSDQLIRVFWLIQAGGREGYGMCSEPPTAEAGMKFQLLRHAMCSPWEYVPGSQDPGTGGLHRLLGGEVWIVTCGCTESSCWLQQQP